MRDLEYRIIIQKNEEGEGYWAFCPDLPGCNSIGDTLEEVRNNIKEAVEGYIEVLRLMNKEIPKVEEENLIIEKIRVMV